MRIFGKEIIDGEVYDRLIDADKSMLKNKEETLASLDRKTAELDSALRAIKDLHAEKDVLKINIDEKEKHIKELNREVEAQIAHNKMMTKNAEDNKSMQKDAPKKSKKKSRGGKKN